MVETLDQGFAVVPSLQPMDSHFIYQAVNLKAPNSPAKQAAGNPSTRTSLTTVSRTELNFCHADVRALNHTCIVFSADQLKGGGLKKGSICKMDVL